MKGLLNINSKFGRMVFQFGQLILLSICWVIFSLPIVTCGAASCALYASCRKILQEEEGRVTSTFYAAFKDNFKQGCIIGTVMVLLIALCALCALLMVAWNVFSNTIGIIAGILYLIVVVAVLTYFHYLLAYVTRFEDKLGTVVRNCVYLSLVHLDTSLRIMVQLAVLLVAAYFLELYLYVPIIVMLVPGVYAVLLVDPLEKVFKQYFPKEETAEAPSDE